jgi:hypothetical protein
MARSTLEGVVWNVFATWGYNTFVMALAWPAASKRGLLAQSRKARFVND